FDAHCLQFRHALGRGLCAAVKICRYLVEIGQTRPLDRFRPICRTARKLVRGLRETRIEANAKGEYRDKKTLNPHWGDVQQPRIIRIVSAFICVHLRFTFTSRQRPLNRCICARLSSRSDSRFFKSSRLSYCALPLPTPKATFTFPFFQ